MPETKRQFRSQPLLIAARATPSEKAMVQAAARIDGLTEHELVRQILFPEVGRRLAAQARILAGGEGDPLKAA